MLTAVTCLYGIWTQSRSKRLSGRILDALTATTQRELDEEELRFGQVVGLATPHKRNQDVD
jgi:Arc/MetJ family transcription regulator